MFGKFRNKIALAVLAGVSAIALGSTANARSVDLVYGNYDSGWTASWEPAFDNVIDISVDWSPNGLVIQKTVNYTSLFQNSQGGLIDPAVITFSQRSGADLTDDFSAYATTITINDEALTNNTGADWTAFRMFVYGGGATFDQNASANFSVNPFTNSAFISEKELDSSGGTIADGAIWKPGSVSGVLVINANPWENGKNTFNLKEQPISAIPLPAAVWSGLSGLVGLGLLASRKKLKKLA